ncbi:MAG: 3-dehydroquinate synthase [Planctomycetes bacterium]|jgi:3-dehydroquinate synthase|nr:3-dehydroquinate synthase [Planctomycetota bacterium]MDP6407946.1 3-dehydroquinate synthase family protein [Planctomycetota bacterium]
MTTSILVATEPAYEVRIGRGILDDVAAAVANHTTAAVITDTRVAELYRSALVDTDGFATCVLPPGEETKSLAYLERVLSFLACAGLDRGGCVITLGGGVIGDLGGLAAALYMRGIAFHSCPTSLLAQLDASVGGKTAVNLPEGKNLAGAFHQPTAVSADTAVLATLEDEEWRSGLGEMLKTALVGGERALAALEEGAPALRERSGEGLEELISSCVAIKARVVADDPGELAGRQVLNLGHSFGHAIERVAGFGSIPHGIAVAAGIGLALECSRRTGLLSDSTLPERAARLAGELGLPGDLEALRARTGLPLASSELAESMLLDKKGRRGVPRLVLVRGPGELVCGVEMNPSLLAEVLA